MIPSVPPFQNEPQSTYEEAGGLVDGFLKKRKSFKTIMQCFLYLFCFICLSTTVLIVLNCNDLLLKG